MDTAEIRHDLGYQETVSRREALERNVVWHREHPPKQGDAVQFDYATEDVILSRATDQRRSVAKGLPIRNDHRPNRTVKLTLTPSPYRFFFPAATTTVVRETTGISEFSAPTPAARVREEISRFSPAMNS